MSKQIRVLIGDNGLPVRIFRDRSWRDLPADKVRIMNRSEAVGSIRTQVFERCYNWELCIWECEKCGRRITPQTGEMNEKRPRGAGGGKTAGEVSLENCEALCHNCHTGNSDSAHGNRRWQTAKLSPEG